YAAGSGSAADGMKYCLQAAQAAVQQPAVNEAREYIKMARECANVAGLDEDGQDFITLECHLAHISGEHRAEMAQKCMDYLEIETNPTPEFLMIAARSCYDGAMDQRDQSLFAKAVELGEQLVNHPQAKPTDQADGFHFIGLSLPPTEADQRKQNLSRAFDLLTDFDTEDIPAQALLARIANSFALQLEREDPAKASRLYQQSVDIKNRPELRDINGLAISHNGLGRIHIFGQPPNPAQARYHFEISLEFAERIGSAIGICKSSSFLGMCAKTEEKHDDAVEYYQRSYDYAQGSFDRGFAAAGLLESLCNVQDLERMNEFGPLFLAQVTTDGEVPGPTISAITGALDRCQEHSSADWLTELRSMIPETEA
ncbi:MAG: hypothetical protein QGF90_00510, partial [Gammaproteobacteria bacterium]|nr:hypothetical protein [Gammaproteobacteria bacterium]